MKNIMKLLLSLFLILIASGCESVDGANYATNINEAPKENTVEQKITTEAAIKKDERVTNAGLIISGEEVPNISTDYFGTLTFTFRNTTDEWVRIKKIRVFFDNEEIDKNIFVPIGDDLYEWQKAMGKKIQIDYTNSSTFLTTVALVSGITAAVTNNKTVRDISAIAMTGAMIEATIDDYNTSNKIDKIEMTAYPEDHLLAGGFAIPPGLFVNKFIVLNSKNNDKIGYLSSVNIEYETDKGVIDKVKLQFRKNPYITEKVVDTDSKWQKKILKNSNNEKLEKERKERKERNENMGVYNK